MPSGSTIQKVSEELYLISLPVPIDGFDGFVTAWLYTGGPVVLVDVGPSSGAAHLLDALADLGVARPDLILLTHIHLDHAGAIGDVAAAFPNTPVVCHPKAMEHIIDPRRLWEGSLKTLGQVAQKYGPMSPVSAGQVVAADRLERPDIIAIPTPGHAPHQYAYLIGDLLFAGEAGGVCLCLGPGRFYMRPATPPKLHLETYLESIDRLMAYKPGRICYGHIGLREEALARLQSHRAQLMEWRRMIQPWFDGDPENARGGMAACLAHLLANDPLLSGFSELSAAAQERERFFLGNSVRGYWGYLCANCPR
jgi:glyoxylase-like metal-dependent hydrolase (beta-lactamase superfamily II)